MRVILPSLLLLSGPAMAAGLDGAALSLAWMLPFAGLLLSIAILPLLWPRFWHRHYGKVAAGWAGLLLLPLAALLGPAGVAAQLLHIALQEYLPFIALLLALYTTGGGVLVTGSLVGTPATNTALLALGTALASVMGTTGASMLLIRPMLRANALRTHKTHIFVFFILLVSNIGGALTPVGDPPLYLGFLAGVAFFWPAQHLAAPFLLCAVLLLAAFYLIDRRAWAKEAPEASAISPRRPGLQGGANLGLILLVVAAVVTQGVWRPGDVTILGERLGLERVLAILLFAAIALASWRLTPRRVHEANDFGWAAMAEVAKLFAAIFICMAPVLAILQAGPMGAAARLVALTTDAQGQPIPWVYFWLTGVLSAFLDNAPTYLVFFNLAGGDAAWLMADGARVLAAISAGAVFFGAMTYIGNAPNFLVLAMATQGGVHMPGFFGYLGWTCVLLLPLFGLVTMLFFI